MKPFVGVIDGVETFPVFEAGSKETRMAGRVGVESPTLVEMSFGELRSLVGRRVRIEVLDD